MPTFDAPDGVTINYIDEGAGPAIVLVHGFASSLQGNWRAPGMVAALIADGRRVVALDCRATVAAASLTTRSSTAPARCPATSSR